MSRTARKRRKSYDFAYLIALHFHLVLNLTKAVGSDTTTFLTASSSLLIPTLNYIPTRIYHAEKIWSPTPQLTAV